jgi:hypothetical protein
LKKILIHVGEDGFVSLNHFTDCIDIKKVKYYSVKLNSNQTLTLKFYDKNKKFIKASLPDPRHIGKD